MAIYGDVITSLITRWETRSLRGYIPCDPANYLGGPQEGHTPIGVSGVTIATGLDLGQQGLADLKRFGIAGTLQDKLMPYLGRTRYRAMDALNLRPLTVSEAECDTITQGVFADYTRRAAVRYDRAALYGLTFADLPAGAQAVIVSLFYHLGSPARYPEGVWDALIAGNWRRAAKALCADDSRYYRRRRDEAAWLSSAIRSAEEQQTAILDGSIRGPKGESSCTANTTGHGEQSASAMTAKEQKRTATSSDKKRGQLERAGYGNGGGRGGADGVNLCTTQGKASVSGEERSWLVF